MKAYPSIPHYNKGYFGEPCYAFEKLDGSNIRAEWSRKSGWNKFGSRSQMIDASHDQFGEAVRLFEKKYASDLAKVFKRCYREVDNFVVFLEYFGPNSFAGVHDPNDKMDLILFDVNKFKQGLIPPKEFVNKFGHLHIPRIIYQGNYNQELIWNVQDSDLNEGVVCKGVRKKLIWMAKIKTRYWLNRLKEVKGETELVRELNNDKALISEIKKFV